MEAEISSGWILPRRELLLLSSSRDLVATESYENSGSGEVSTVYIRTLREKEPHILSAPR